MIYYFMFSLLIGCLVLLIRAAVEKRQNVLGRICERAPLNLVYLHGYLQTICRHTNGPFLLPLLGI